MGKRAATPRPKPAPKIKAAKAAAKPKPKPKAFGKAKAVPKAKAIDERIPILPKEEQEKYKQRWASFLTSALWPSNLLGGHTAIFLSVDVEQQMLTYKQQT